MKRHRDIQGKRGFVLLTMGIAAVVLFGMMGLAIDVGRMYISKNEAQSFADAGAITAALQLNGTAAGISTAADIVSSNSNRHELGTIAFTAAQVTVEYAPTATSVTWVSDAAAQASPAGLLFSRVTVNTPVSLYFLPVVVPQTTTTVPAVAVAGQVQQLSYSQGLFPFSPMTIAPTAAPNFGFVPLYTYSLRFGAGKPDLCTGEVTNEAAYRAADDARGSPNRGYWTAFNSNSNSLIKQQIINDLQGAAVAIGDMLPVVNGDRQAEFTSGGAVPTRVLQDTDSASMTYAQYQASGTGNGRRLVGMPISDPFDNNIVVGYAEFFLRNVYPGSGNENYCAEYVGPWTQDTTTQGGGPTGGYKVRLVQ